MSDALWAARLGDALTHTSMMADILGGVLEVAANVAITALATAAVAAAAGITLATAGIGGCILCAVVGLVVGMAMSKTEADKGLSKMCEDLANAIFPPTIQANIAVGSPNTLINSIPAARAAGIAPAKLEASGTLELEPPPEDASAPEPGFLDIAEGFFSQLWRPTVASPAPGVVPRMTDFIACTRHPPMPPQLLAEGSEKVTINGQPAVRSGDRSMCDATVVSSGLISPNVTIGGGTVVVQEIRSGKTPGVGLAIEALMLLKGAKGKTLSNLPCLLLGAVGSYAVSQAMGAAANAAVGSPNPVHAALGAKVLGADNELDFVLPGHLPIGWQRFYNSRDDRRDGLFGAGWSVPYEISVQVQPHPDGGEQLIYTDEQGRRIEIGSLPPGSAMFSSGEGLGFRRHRNGQLLIDSEDGLYRLFDPTPGTPSLLRLSQLGDRNDNRIYLDYDETGRISRLRDTFDLVRVELIYDKQWPRRVRQIERLYADQRREVLTSYTYDPQGDLAEAQDAGGQVQRRFVYDENRRMVEHQLPTGLRCFYQWALLEDTEWRVVRHWTDEGDEYQFHYDLQAGITTITDSLQRTSTRKWNRQHQITEYTDNLGLTWQFEWNDERQLLNATDPAGGRYEYSYDESGNLTETLDPAGRRESIAWLEHWALPLTQVDKGGNCWQFLYDSRGNCIKETDPLGHATQYRYDAHGQAVEIIDAIGKSKKLRWNTLGQLVEHIDCSNQPTRFSYDNRGYLQTTTNALGEHTHYRYDIRGRLIERQLPDGRTEHFQRDAIGQLIGYKDPAGHLISYQHNRRGQVSQRRDAHGRAVQFSYDRFGRLQALINENNERYRFEWDAGNRLSAQYNLDGSAHRYIYDSLSQVALAETTPAPSNDPLSQESVGSIVHRMERDPVGRLLRKITEDGRTEYAYDAAGKIAGIVFIDHQGNEQKLAFAYDAMGHLIEEHCSGASLHHRYDELGNLIQTLLPDGRWVNRLYYGSGHLHQLNLDGQVISDFERDRLHREVLRTQGQITTRSEYGQNGRLRTRTHRPTGQPSQLPASAQQHFDYDASDNLIERIEQQPAGQLRQLLHYDASGRIVASQNGTQGQSETFAYDAAANLLDGPPSGSGLVKHNKLLTYQDKRYRYDAFGRLIEKRSVSRGTQHFRYDAESRLIEVRNRQGTAETVVTMAYDPLGRRVEKTECSGDGHLLGKTRFSWDALQLLQEHRNELTSLYLYVDNSYEPLARVDGTGPQQKFRYYHNDLNGLPERLVEADGQPIWQARYRTWGDTFEEIREAHYIEEQNLRYQGQYLDRETGLHYNTFRFYDPQIGRFITPDPLGLVGGINLYCYAPNPFTWMDPLGLATDAGTTTFYHAGDIQGPIDPSKGRGGLDFDPAGKGGFYVTTDKAQAVEWAAMRDHPTITQFDVPNSELAKLNIKTFDSPNGEWGEFVTKGRQGTLDHSHDAVSGPMLRNSTPVKFKGATPKPKGSQFAIYSKKAAALFDRFKIKGCS